MRIYPQSRLIKLDARSAVIAWLLLAASFVLLMLAGPFQLPVTDTLIAAGSACMLAVLAHVAFALAHKCPSCGKHPTIEGFAPHHSNSETSKGVGGWARVVLDVLKKEQFTCIHCGEQFSVSDAA